MTHLLTDFLAARLTGVAGMKADFLHLRGPFRVVVSAPARLAMMLLPEVHHFMHQRGERFPHGPVQEVLRVHRNLVGAIRAAYFPEAFCPVIAERPPTTSLQGDQAAP